MQPLDEREESFIDASWEEDILPKEMRYMYRYFGTDTEKVFLRYFWLFGKTSYFNDHTGRAANKKFLDILRKRYLKLQEVHAKAKSEKDTAMLAEIESGNLTSVYRKKKYTYQKKIKVERLHTSDDKL